MEQRSEAVALVEGLMDLNAIVQRYEAELPVLRRGIQQLTVRAERLTGRKAREDMETPNDHR